MPLPQLDPAIRAGRAVPAGSDGFRTVTGGTVTGPPRLEVRSVPGRTEEIENRNRTYNTDSTGLAG